MDNLFIKQKFTRRDFLRYLIYFSLGLGLNLKFLNIKVGATEGFYDSALILQNLFQVFDISSFETKVNELPNNLQANLRLFLAKCQEYMNNFDPNTGTILDFELNKIKAEINKYETLLSLKLQNLEVTDPLLASIITSIFGPRGYTMHLGVDYIPITNYAITNYDVIATISGNVTKVYNSCVDGDRFCNYGYGNFIVISNGVYETLYAHLSEITVSLGGVVKSGDKIGVVGNTGNSSSAHLHFEFKINNATVNPLILLELAKQASDQVTCASPSCLDTFDLLGLLQQNYQKWLELYLAKRAYDCILTYRNTNTRYNIDFFRENFGLLITD